MDTTVRHELSGLSGPILLTGHTGFKGTWLSLYLKHLGIPTIGYSLGTSMDALYSRTNQEGKVPEIFADIRDYRSLENFIHEYKPKYIIHLAAQPLVLDSYKNPRETFDVNVMGTANVLDIAFKKDFVEGIVVVTTDKVYKNENFGKRFQENDPLEGKDPYSASKVSAESVVRAWQQIARISGGPQVTSVRAGNVIGGGDLAQNRLIPDLVRSYISGSKVEIRNPQSTRPWQHVLDPLRGYLMVLEKISTNQSIDSINFGPSEESLAVSDVVEICKDSLKLQINYSRSNFDIMSKKNPEAETLSLDSSYASKAINWKPIWNQETSIKKTLDWWKNVIEKEVKAEEVCANDIEQFITDLGK
jgi:CDP-glucose 4,6-dehydratase